MAARGAARPGAGVLWLPILAGPLLWSLTELVLYPVSAQACHTGGLPPAVAPGAADARWFGGVWVLASLVLAAAAAMLAVRSLRRAREASGSADAVRVRFMAYSGVIVSTVFLYAIVLNGLGIALSGKPCG